MKEIVVLTLFVFIRVALSQGEENENYQIVPEKPRVYWHFGYPQAFFEAKCMEISTPASYKRAKNADGVFQRVDACFWKEINEIKMLTNQTKEDLRGLFSNICGKALMFKECILNFYKDFEVCFRDEEKEGALIFFNMIDSFRDFMCYNNSNDIIRFIKEQGPQCWYDKLVPIVTCAISTLAQYIPLNLPLINSAPTFLKCNEIKKLQDCVVGELRECKHSAAAFTDSLCNSIIKATPCNSGLSIKTAFFTIAPMIIAPFIIKINV